MSAQLLAGLNKVSGKALAAGRATGRPARKSASIIPTHSILAFSDIEHNQFQVRFLIDELDVAAIRPDLRLRNSLRRLPEHSRRIRLELISHDLRRLGCRHCDVDVIGPNGNGVQCPASNGGVFPAHFVHTIAQGRREYHRGLLKHSLTAPGFETRLRLLIAGFPFSPASQITREP